jgi:hypothetical protein
LLSLLALLLLKYSCLIISDVQIVWLVGQDGKC